MKDERSANSSRTQNIVGLGCSLPQRNRLSGVRQLRPVRIEGYKIFLLMPLDLALFGVV